MESAFLDTIVPRQEWESRHKRKTPGPRQPKWRHNPMDEKTPDHSFFSMDTYEMNDKTRIKLQKLMSILEKHPDIEETNDLAEQVAPLMNGPTRHDWSFAIIGDNGEGKSTLTNSLLARYGLAAKSGGTKSCTQYATRYEHLLGAPDDTAVSDVTVQFYSHDSRTKITQEHIKNISLVHHHPNNGDRRG